MPQKRVIYGALPVTYNDAAAIANANRRRGVIVSGTEVIILLFGTIQTFVKWNRVLSPQRPLGKN